MVNTRRDDPSVKKTVRKRDPTKVGAGKPGPGRPKGTPNKATAEAKVFARELVDDPAYRQKLREALLERKVAPAIEAMVWAYGYGRPKEFVEATVTAGVIDLERMAEQARAAVFDCPDAEAAEAYVRQLEEHVEAGRRLRERRGAS